MGLDVRWVRFPKHIPLFSTLSQLESVGSWNSYNWVQRMVREEIGLSNENSSLVLIPYYLKSNYFPLDFLGGAETTTFEDLDPAGPLGVGNTV